MKKDVKKSSYYVWFLGAQECRNIRDVDSIRPVIANLAERERKVAPHKFTLQISHRGLKIVHSASTQLSSLPGGGGKSSKGGDLVKHLIPDHAVTCVHREDDLVAVILLLYNPVTRWPVHVHVYRCDSVETAALLSGQLHVLVDRPENRKKLDEIELKLRLQQTAAAEPPAGSGGRRRGSSSPPPPPPLSSSSSPPSESGAPPAAMTALYDSLAAELKKKLQATGGKSGAPILLPPRDYDTVHRHRGNLNGIDFRRCKSANIVGVNGGGGAKQPRPDHRRNRPGMKMQGSSGGSSGIGSDHAPSPEQYEPENAYADNSSSDEDWNASPLEEPVFAKPTSDHPLPRVRRQDSGVDSNSSPVTSPEKDYYARQGRVSPPMVKRHHQDQHNVAPESRDRYSDPREKYSDSRDTYPDPRDKYPDPRDKYPDPRDKYPDPRGKYSDRIAVPDRRDNKHPDRTVAPDQRDKYDRYSNRNAAPDPRDKYSDRNAAPEPRDKYSDRNAAPDPRDKYSDRNVALVQPRPRNGGDQASGKSAAPTAVVTSSRKPVVVRQRTPSPERPVTKETPRERFKDAKEKFLMLEKERIDEQRLAMKKCLERQRKDNAAAVPAIRAAVRESCDWSRGYDSDEARDFDDREPRHTGRSSRSRESLDDEYNGGGGGYPAAKPVSNRRSRTVQQDHDDPRPAPRSYSADDYLEHNFRSSPPADRYKSPQRRVEAPRAAPRRNHNFNDMPPSPRASDYKRRSAAYAYDDGGGDDCCSPSGRGTVADDDGPPPRIAMAGREYKRRSAAYAYEDHHQKHHQHGHGQDGGVGGYGRREIQMIADKRVAAEDAAAAAAYPPAAPVSPRYRHSYAEAYHRHHHQQQQRPPSPQDPVYRHHNGGSLQSSGRIGIAAIHPY